MADFVLNVEVFEKRMGRVLESWSKDNTNEGLWNGADVLVLAAGKSTAASAASKPVTMQTWLFDVELPDCVILATSAKELTVCSSQKKVDILRQLARDGSPFTFDFLVRNKADGNAANWSAMLAKIANSRQGSRLGICGGEKAETLLTGKFAKSFFAAIRGAGVPLVAIDTALSAELVTKDEVETANIRKAAELAAAVVNSVTVKRIEVVLDKGTAVTHAQLSTEAANAFTSPSAAGLTGFDDELADMSYTPMIQSGADVRAGALVAPSGAPLAKRGVFLVSMGGRYNLYNANVARSVLVNATDKVDASFAILRAAHQFCISAATPGKTFAALYEETLAFVEAKEEGLGRKLAANFGSSIGIELVEPDYVLGPSCTARIRAGMVLNISLAFRKLSDKKSKRAEMRKFELALADTVLVAPDGPVNLTAAVPYEIVYVLDDTAETEAARAARLAEAKAALDAQAVLDERLRKRGSAQTETSAADEQRIRDHQSELAQKTLEEAIARHSGEAAARASSTSSAIAKINSYPTPAAFPRAARPDAIFVDISAETVFLPIYGHAVPFHVSTIKSASKSDEGEYVYVRFNFVTPTASGKKRAFEDPHSMFVREVSFRVPMTHARNLNTSLRHVQELRKRIAAREKDRRERADLVDQERLRLLKGPIPRLSSVEIRPRLAGRKEIGVLEAHANGLRFTSRTGARVDIIYANIRHAFFQPSKSELIVLIHFHLHNPIMVGKKKTKDVQFLQMAYNVERNLSGRNARSAFDIDELEDEQRERRERAKKNANFKKFAEAVEAVVETNKPDLDLQFDVPYRDLGFHGVPERSTVFLQPTVNCLVHLVETPFVVITIDDIEIVHFERVRFSLRNFDMVIVWKDYSKAPLHINSIESKYLDAIKEWLDGNNVKFYEGQANLNWTAVMKHITDDVPGFFTDGGWSFLEDDDEEEEEVIADSDESEFEPSGDDDDDDDEFEFESGEGTESSYSAISNPDDELSEEGLDDEALEREARREDMKRSRRERDDVLGSSRPSKRSKHR
ncbi:FACT complex subunit SPT16 [Thecamonas trahens ATCC 50062]|uniref:FACT complex subunit n=1 Tax=Thecamonas trahens ATCC 50062 TaxID=461836 RepID=A0A0L0DV63_THETB|nr:FACT complex subunit SPT16 [Thecamonas trahens ATCC 50062]KNC56189.1 FACT complex subunit SPT16 [Thecamonas trahens ATCC 50062]|eukprot:XP_013761219.1 FACT complex subunit SPT16 [Thecamonas trahens ATCC 50062]